MRSEKKSEKNEKNEKNEKVGKTGKTGRIGRKIWFWSIFCLSAVLVGIGVLLAADEVLALTDPDISHTVTVSEVSVRKTAELLADEGIVGSKTLLSLYLHFQGGDPVLGDHTFSEAMSYRAIAAELRGEKRAKHTTVSITFPEGITVPEVIDRFLAAGIGKRETLEALAREGDFDYDFLPPAGGEYAYRLEGFLYPDTYEFFSDTDERTALCKLLDQFERKFDSRYRERCQALQKTPNEIVTLASMIQSEAKYPDEYGKISAVFSNRLKHRGFPRLESDATVRYALLLKGEGLRRVTPSDLTVASPYNTYQNGGLPPGAIASPGIDAINAALFPENTKDYYFVAASSGRTLFARTYSEHQANMAKSRKD